ncbi:hypothetical protein LOTGIDRAFT_170009 [Lottia gigantea]|uniref:Uncharacterized protein n=1 Tax=Lottia gigantea TaxID=225164 RepID=V3ZNG6_LOTGI|nr:hypothetical protein LOTGIDRAFT_170009 [Lottia gigantea]ESO82386.1 hypothetical protein LOTGIDRAFT_170009 [Lottia gigantea]
MSNHTPIRYISSGRGNTEIMNRTMAEKVFSIFGLLLIVLVLITDSRKLDCTKFVFAPKCRGVAAKRNTDYNFPIIPSHQRLQSKIVPSLEDNWTSEDDDSLQFLKGLRYLISKMNNKQPSPPYSTDDSRFWRKFFPSR